MHRDVDSSVSEVQLMEMRFGFTSGSTPRRRGVYPDDGSGGIVFLGEYTPTTDLVVVFLGEERLCFSGSTPRRRIWWNAGALILLDH